MDQQLSHLSLPRRRHLLSPEMVSAHRRPDIDLTRGHRQGNGVRVHGLYFAAVSVVALVMIIAAIALASTRM